MEDLPTTRVPSLEGRTAIITGGACGMGAATARLFVERGARVVIADLRAQEGEALVRELGADAMFRRLDVGEETGWQAVVTAAEERFDPIDTLVNCAGILLRAPITSMEKDVFEKVLQVNLVGMFLGLKHAGGAMARHGRGSIINFSSAQGLRVGNSMAAYASSKWGVRGLTRVAALEFGPANVRVNSIHPGPVNTAMVNPEGKPAEALTHLPMLSTMPINRVAEAREVAELCAFLASDAAAFITGAEIAIDGGMTAGAYYGDRPRAPS